MWYNNPITGEKGITYKDKYTGKSHREKFSEYEGYPNYVVSNLGRAYSKVTNRETHSNKNYKGYLRVFLYDKYSKRHTVYIHRVIAECFVKKTDRDLELHRHIVHFRDWDRTHITQENLIWVNDVEMRILKVFYEKSRKTSSILDADLLRYLDFFIESSSNYSVKEIMDIFNFKSYHLIEDEDEIKELIKKRKREYNQKK